jgi:hypothetical protein
MLNIHFSLYTKYDIFISYSSTFMNEHLFFNQKLKSISVKYIYQLINLMLINLIININILMFYFDYR